MAGIEKLIATGIVDKSGNDVTSIGEKFKGKTVGLYFSAHWCPPCRGFTPVLAEFYKKHATKKNFEIIFISSDRDEESFDEYYGEMPWLALKYSERLVKDELSQQFRIRGIPTLVLLNADSGEIVCSNARGKVQSEDPEAENFPWSSEA